MHARGFLIRGSGLVVLTLSVFYGCGGLNEPDVKLDGAALDTSDAGPAKCGDGKDQCSGSNLRGATCQSVTLNSGSKGNLSCNSQCRFDTSDCSGANGSGGSGTGGTGGSVGTGGGFGTGGAVGTGGRRGGGGGVVGTAGTTGGAGAPTVQCTSDASCSRNRVCCADQQGAFSCQQACPRNDVPVACGKPSDCPSGQSCCEALNGTQSAYTALSCAAQCGANDFVLCTNNGDCGQGTTCQASRLLPSEFKVCR